jgi:hypothetical protein
VIPVAIASAVLFALFAAKDGGFAPTVWLPAGIFIAALLALALVFASTGLRRVEMLAVGFLASFTAWTGLSILWAEVRGDAWDGANRTLLYLCVFSLFVVLPWRARSAALFLSAFAVGVTGVVVVQFLRAAAAPVAHHAFFISGRLASPISYSNADAALLMMTAFPAVVVASRRETPVVVRGLLLATAGCAIELAVACQSRMSLIAVPLTALFLFGFAGRRVRLLVAVLPVAAIAALAATRMLDIYGAVLAGPGGAALTAARTALIVSAGALFVLGCGVGIVDRRVEPSRRIVRASGILALAAVLAAAVVGVAAAARAAPHPLRTLEHRWTSFSHDKGYTDLRKSHLFSGGSNRYDIWRVALDEFVSAPVVGIGADNFAVDYLRHRRSSDSPAYPHSILLRILSQTGVVGAILFAFFLGAAAVAVGRAVGGVTHAAAVTTAAASVFVYWLVHGSVDWLWEIPALGAPAFACLAIAVRLGAGERVEATGRRVPAPLVVVGAAASIALFGLPWIAAQETAVAGSSWVSDHSAAFHRLDVAASLNPLSDLPAETKGLIAARSHEPTVARRAFAQALVRNPSNWFAQLELGVMEATLGQRAEALSALARAKALDPKEPLIDAVRRRVRRGSRVSQEFVDSRLTEAG